MMIPPRFFASSMIALSAMILLSTTSGCTQFNNPFRPIQGTIEIKTLSPVVPDRPVRLSLHIHNTSSTDLSYWSGGGSYPGAQEFSATLQSADQPTSHPVKLSNGVIAIGSGIDKKIPPGTELEMLAVIPPLKPGDYQLNISSGRWNLVSQSISFTIPADPNAEAYDQQVIDDIHKGSSLASHIAYSWPTPKTTAALLQDIQSTDIPVAGTAIYILNRIRPLPTGTTPALVHALGQLAVSGTSDGRLAVSLSDLAVSDKSTEALEALVPIAHMKIDGEARWRVLLAIGRFPQPKAAETLHQYLNDPVPYARLGAASGLANRHDPAAIPVLISLANDTEAHLQGSALYDLGLFPDSPPAVDAINQALKNPRTNWDARRASDRLKK